MMLMPERCILHQGPSSFYWQGPFKTHPVATAADRMETVMPHRPRTNIYALNIQRQRQAHWSTAMLPTRLVHTALLAEDVTDCLNDYGSSILNLFIPFTSGVRHAPVGPTPHPAYTPI
eukprot:scaffold405881_cov23-Prasinocladus_malaysianus.AAC.1